MAMPKRRFTLISYIVLQFISVYLQVNSLIKRSFAGHSPRLSFLSVSLYHIKKERKKERKKEKKDRSSGIRQGAIFLKFLFMVLREQLMLIIFCAFKTERSRF